MRARWFSLGLLCGSLTTALVAVPAAQAAAGDVDAGYRKLRVFSQVLTYVQQSYVDAVDAEGLIYDAIQGMLAHLDPHTTFLRPAEYEKLREDTAGEFGGLGIEVGVSGEGDDAVVLVEAVHKDGPGAHAGLRAGDLVVGIDGESTRGTPLPHAVRLMRGVPGTRVVLTILRAAWSKPRDVPLVRRQVRMPSVDGENLEAGSGGVVGYVAISSFQERTDQELGAKVTELRRQAREHGATFSGLVLDLRDNPGGLLDEGVKVADRFLAGGVIVSTLGRNTRNNERSLAHADGTEPAYPLVVLVNGNTASASEIVAGALQDHRRAVVVGERSFGKGSVQTLFGLDDGAGLKLTIARYFTPSGRSIQDTGVVPDVVVRAGVAPVGPGAARGAARVAADPQLAAAMAQVTRRPAAGKG
ncbi:MAG: S41 family peptidase [Deltaproteobacteria bacterium]|nr:S41 family peptidase [Deltaproteobacteria bacterium]